MLSSIVQEESPVEAPRARSGSRAFQQHEFLQSLGRRVQSTRLSRGMTRKALAESAGVSERHLANLEHGTGNASIVVLLQVAQALGCALGALFGSVASDMNGQTVR